MNVEIITFIASWFSAQQKERNAEFRNSRKLERQKRSSKIPETIGLGSSITLYNVNAILRQRIT